MAAGDVYWSSPRHIVRFGADGAVLDIRRPSQWDGVSSFGYDNYQAGSTCGSDGRVYSLCDVLADDPSPNDAWGEIYEENLAFHDLWGEGAALPEDSIAFLHDVVTDWSDGTFWVVGNNGSFFDNDPDAYDYNCWHVDTDGTLLSRHYLDVTGDGEPNGDVYHAAMPRGSTSLFFSDEFTIGKFDTVSLTQTAFYTPLGDSINALAAAQDGTVYAWSNNADGILVLNSSGVVVDIYNYDNGAWNGSSFPNWPIRLALDVEEVHLLLGASGDNDSIWRINRATQDGDQEPWVTLNGVVDSIGQSVDYGTTTGLWIGVDPEPAPCSPPLNDDWTDAQVLAGDSGSVTGTTVCATQELDEPEFGPPAAGDNTVWYDYTPSASGVTTFFIDPDGLTIRVEVFTGPNLAALVGPVASYEGADPLSPMAVPVIRDTTYWIRVYNDVPGESGPFTLSWDLVPRVAVVVPLDPTPPSKLGCSKHVAYVQNKCNGRRLCELQNASDIHYTRRLDEVSEATVTIPISGDVMTPCCSCLADVEPWCHQLTIVREGDGVVWTGPIQSVRYGRDTVTIEAKDKLAWLQFRVNEINLEYIGNATQPLTEIAEDIMILAMADSVDGDSTCFLEDAQGNSLIIIPPGIPPNLSDGRPVGFKREFVFEAFAGPTAYDDLVQLANAGMDFTVINHNVILTGEDLPTRAIGILTDEMILGDVELIKDGTSMGNRFYVRYEGNGTTPGDDDPAQCLAQCNAFHGVVCPRCADPLTEPCYTVPCPGLADLLDNEVGCYDRIERVVDGINATDLDTANGIADRYLERGKTAPRLIELPSGTRLGPDCPWRINEMIPGQRVDVALSTLCFPVFQSFKLQSMEVTDNGSDESITVDLLAVEQTT